MWHGLGCLTATLLVVGTFYAYTVPAILAFMSAVPAIFAILYARVSYPAPPYASEHVMHCRVLTE